MRLLGIIPARGGSKGVPRKNIKLLGNKPLIQYTIDTALASGALDEVMVSTEDREIANVAQSLGAGVPFLRPAHLASDQSPTIDAVVHVLETYVAMGERFDAVCLLQPTNPLRTVETIRRSVSKFMESGADSLVTVREVPHEFNPHWTFEEDDSGYLHIATRDKQIIPRRQELPKAYYRDGEIYLTKSETILKKRSLYGENIAFINLDGRPSVNIDTQDDWAKAEKMLCAE